MRAREIVRDGKGVRIRPLLKEDLPYTLEWRNSVESLLWFKTAQLLQWDSHLAWYEKYQASAGEDCMFFVETLGGRGVGQASIYNVDAGARQAEVGRFLSDPELRGRGLFREAILLTLGVAFKDMGLKSVYLEVFEDNRRAIRLYESVGFTPVGSFEEGLIRMNLDCYAFLKSAGVK